MKSRSFTQPETPLDYRNQAAVPDHDRYQTAWRVRSLNARKNLASHLDVPYGSHPLETLDIFGASKNAPVFVFIHGGWWHFLDKSDYSYVARPYVVQGAICVCINYPLAPEGTIGGIVASTRNALLWVYRNIARYGGDPERISVAGHSAGGHLAAMMGFTDWSEMGAPVDMVKTACAISGLFDLIPILDTPHNLSIHMDRSTAEQQSPIDAVVENNCHHIVCVGADETPGFLWQHKTFMKVCEAHGVFPKELTLSGEHHFSVVDRVADEGSPLFRAIFERM